MTTYHTAEAAFKVIVFKPNYCWSFGFSSPLVISVCPHSIHSQLRYLSLSLSHSSSPSPPSVPVHPFAERRIVCMKKQEIREMSSFSSLFRALFCGSWPSPSKMLMCFSCTAAFPVFSLCCHSSLPFFK